MSQPDAAASILDDPRASFLLLTVKNTPASLAATWKSNAMTSIAIAITDHDAVMTDQAIVPSHHSKRVKHATYFQSEHATWYYPLHTLLLPFCSRSDEIRRESVSGLETLATRDKLVFRRGFMLFAEWQFAIPKLYVASSNLVARSGSVKVEPHVVAFCWKESC